MYHVPVMLEECLEGLAIRPDGVYVDVTFGGGGHSREILKRIGDGRLLSFDQDQDAKRNAEGFDAGKFTLVEANFRHLKRYLRVNGVTKVDGILADLGISSYQIDTAERGFSIRYEAELDMRMNQAQELSARTLVNEYSEKDLADVLWKYGELRNSRQVARAIAQNRINSEIVTTADLVKIVSRFSQRNKEMQFLAKVFQAIRIEVNDEMGALYEMLEQGLEVLKPGGRLVVMSYHSLEDRPVKNFMKSGNFKGEIEKDFYGNQLTPFKLITRKAVVAQSEEIANNPRARSAKLRVAEKKETVE